MVNKSSVGIWLAIYVVYRMQSVLEAFVDSDSVTLCFVGLIVGSYRLVHLGLLVYVRQLVFPQGFPATLTLLLRLAYQWDPVRLSVFATYLIVSDVRVRNGLLSWTIVD